MNRSSISVGALFLIALSFGSGCSKEQVAVRATETQRPVPVARPRFDTLVIPDGTIVVASLGTRLSTETSHTGDPFVARTTEPILVGGRIAVPAGSEIRGVLRDVQASGRTSGRARMTLAYEALTDAGGKTQQISAVPLALQAASATHGDVEKIAAGTVIGALIGGVANGGKGAAIGAGAGAGAGAVLMLATKGDEVELEAGQKLSIRMTSPTNVDVLAQR